MAGERLPGARSLGLAALGPAGPHDPAQLGLGVEPGHAPAQRSSRTYG